MDDLVSETLALRGRDRYAAVDLFSGCGGFSLGLDHSGFRTAIAVDNWRPATDTFAANFPLANSINADLREISSTDIDRAARGSAQLVAGGPPCQGFSSAGKRRQDDLRNSLVRRFAILAVELQPSIVLFENVEGFLTAEHGRYVIDLLDPLIEAGYWLHVRKVNAANYGAPQLRKRVIVLGALGAEPPFAPISHRAIGAPGADIIGRDLPVCPTVAEALDGLPPASSRQSASALDHVVTRTGPDVTARIQALAPGDTMSDLPPQLQHKTFTRRAYRRVRDGTALEARGGAPAGLRRLRADQPSKAITGGASREFIHPTEHRYLTLRECARLQGFPDSFRFAGSLSDRAQLIGNAVPVPLACSIAHPLAAWLDGDYRPQSSRRGRLISFMPTTSSGKSPALHRTTESVTRRYGPLVDSPLTLEGITDAS